MTAAAPVSRTATPGSVAALTVEDYADRAAICLPPGVWDFVAGGSGEERTLRANRAALDAVEVLPRVLSGTSMVDTATVLVGTAAAVPVAVAPMAYQRLLHEEGESAMARAARAAGVPMVVSTLSSMPWDAVATGGSAWFQLYWLRSGASPSTARPGRARYSTCWPASSGKP